MLSGTVAKMLLSNRHLDSCMYRLLGSNWLGTASPLTTVVRVLRNAAMAMAMASGCGQEREQCDSFKGLDFQLQLKATIFEDELSTSTTATDIASRRAAATRRRAPEP